MSLRHSRHVSLMSLTVGHAFEMYLDADAGPTSGFSRNYVRTLRRACALLERHIGVLKEWNTVTKADLQRFALKRLQRVGVGQVALELRIFQAIANWLVKYAELDVRNPMHGWNWRWLLRGHVPRRPRYTREEMDALHKVAWEIDPRCAFLLALCDETGYRMGGLVRAKRSHLNRPFHPMPKLHIAPYGWLVIPRSQDKARSERILLFTEQAKTYLDRMMNWILRPLECAYLEGELEDYHLFPGGRLREGVATDAKGHVRYRTLSDWMRRAEDAAGVPHIQGRAYHAIRRLAIDELFEAGATVDEASAAANASERVITQVYRDPLRLKAQARARARRTQARLEPD